MKRFVQRYFKRLYLHAMNEAYNFARSEVAADSSGADFLECGSSAGRDADVIAEARRGDKFSYTGIEWSPQVVAEARARGLDIVQSDLNLPFPVPGESKDCVFALSVLEHLLMPCHFLRECRRVLRPGGRLVLLTPNISTYFTAALILAGRMPSTGPHPDSLDLHESQRLFHLDRDYSTSLEGNAPEHRHLVVFSFRVLRRHLQALNFEIEQAKGFGLYPFPNFLQRFLQRIDPYHCHQMVFVCRKK